VAAFCRKWQIAALHLYGSVLRDDFRPDSDVDVLVTFAPEVHWSFGKHMDMEEELGGILGRKVDLVPRDSVEKSENYIRRRRILSTLSPLYPAPEPALNAPAPPPRAEPPPAAPSPSWRDDSYFLDMLISVRHILKFTEGVDWPKFEKDRTCQYACMHMIDFIARSVWKMSEATTRAHPEIPWEALGSARRRLMREYLEVLPDKVWEFIQREVPPLLPLIEPLVPPEGAEVAWPGGQPPGAAPLFDSPARLC
jgi:predicted nucleotidyltransferase/uncharacterized protein with HEPN domain